MISKTALAALAALVISASSHAALLGITLQPYPDIASGFIDVTYNSASDQFVASGFALTFNDDGNPPNQNISNGSFNITATVNGSGVATSGSIVIGGSVPGFSNPLLTGSLVGMGFLNGGGDIFDFLFTVTGGTLANAYYGGIGAVFGVILDANFGPSGGFTGNWNSNFNNNGGNPGFGSGVSDSAPVPAPGALAVLALVVAKSRRRRFE